jgi:hypothetical protein
MKMNFSSVLESILEKTTMNEPQVVLKKGIYRHAKTGKEYEVVGVALQTETEEMLVIYRPLYDGTDYELFARPLDMFIERVVIDGASWQRFEWLQEAEYDNNDDVRYDESR